MADMSGAPQQNGGAGKRSSEALGGSSAPDASPVKKQRNTEGLPPPDFVYEEANLTVPAGAKSAAWNSFRKHADYPLAVLCLGCKRWLKHCGGNTSTLLQHKRHCEASQAIAAAYEQAGTASSSNTDGILLPGSSAPLASPPPLPRAPKKHKADGTPGASDVVKTPGTTPKKKKFKHSIKVEDLTAPGQMEMLPQQTAEQDIRLLKTIISARLSFGITENPFFQEFVDGFGTSYRLPDQKRAEDLLERNYVVMRAKASAVLNASEAVAITAEGSTQGIVQDGLVAVSAHFLDNAWKWKSLVLSVRPVSEAPLKDMVNSVLQEWDLQGKAILALPESGTKAFKGERNKEQVEELARSGLSVLHFALMTCMKAPDMGALVATLQEISGWINNNPPVRDAFRNLQTRMAQQHQLTRVEDLPSIIDAGQPPQVISAEDPLQDAARAVQEIRSRWYSAFQAIKIFVRQRPAIVQICQQHNSPIIVSDQQWNTLPQLDRLMEAAAASIGRLENEQNRTVGSVWATIAALCKFLRGQIGNIIDPSVPDWGYLTESSTAFRLLLVKQLSEVEKIAADSVPVMVATCLDPRLKSLHFTKNDARVRAQDHLSSKLGKLPQAQTYGSASSSSSSGGHRGRDELDRIIFGSREAPADGPTDEIDQYWSAPEYNSQGNPLDWWRLNADAFPTLSRLAKRYLCIPSSTTLPETVIPKAGFLPSKVGHTIDVERQKKMLCLRYNMIALNM